MDVPDFLTPFDDGPTGGGSSLGHENSLPSFSVEQQKKDFWCWAAVSVSVATFYNVNNKTQCAIAAAVLPPPNNCCGADADSCNKPWNLDDPLTNLGCYSHRKDSLISFSIIQDQIEARRPLCCRINWKGSGAHFIVIAGWSVDPSGKEGKEEYVRLYDPATGADTTVPYVNLCSAYSDVGDQWTHSYFTHLGVGTAIVFDPDAPNNA